MLSLQVLLLQAIAILMRQYNETDAKKCSEKAARRN
jgi:hypothetical protein